MTLTNWGHLGIYVAVAALVWGIIDQLLALRFGRRTHAALVVLLALVGVGESVGIMQYALITHNFSLAYVAKNNARQTPLIYSITGMWSDLEGSILLWSLFTLFCVAAVTIRYRREVTDAVVRWATLTLMAVGLFFTGLMAGPADPFVFNPDFRRSVGAGPNALLQNNPLVAIHPPLLYLGFVGFSIPFAFAIAMLVTGRVNDRWPLEQRRWIVLAWGSLSVAIVMGSWWSYEVLGWGGFWGWDPVENAALLPWLTATAYIHSIIVQDRRGLFRVWNISLAVTTFALTVLGTFFTRSGVLQSVHAFSSSTLGPILISFFLITVGGALVLIIWRGDRLRSPIGIDEPWSREGLFVVNNILFVGFAIVVLLGTIFPLLYEAVNGGQVTVGTPYFAAVAAPVAVVILLLMGIAPLASWRRVSSTVLWERMRWSAWSAVLVVVVLEITGVRKWLALGAYFLATLASGAAIRTIVASLRAARHRDGMWSALRGPSFGGMVAHLGVVLMALGIVTSSSFTTRHEVPLAPGHSAVVAGQVITFEGFRTFQNSVRHGTQLEVRVNNSVTLWPAVTTFYGRANQIVGTPAIDSNLLRDIYVTFDGVGASSQVSGAQIASNIPANGVLLGVTVEPMLAWLWMGGMLLGIGSVISFFRRRQGEVSA
ncbi:MAG: cytochrome c-type biogenesis CcmF C-terminal domain-containing protein [Actinomycetota bacterium]